MALVKVARIVGNVANWRTADTVRAGIGGAMDLISSRADLIIVMEHTNSKGRPKLRRQCSYPLTGAACVDYVVTDLALFQWRDGRCVLKEVAAGFTPREVMDLTDMEIAIDSEVQTMA